MQHVYQKSGMIHHILSRSYSIYLFALIVGVIMDTIVFFRFKFPFYMEIGFLVILLGTLFIYWAQKSSASSKKNALRNKTGHRNFAHGPYKFTRNPTHIGLMFMTLGYGILYGSFFVIILTLFAFITSRLVFLPQQELLLEEKFGHDYREYKRKVHTWL